MRWKMWWATAVVMAAMCWVWAEAPGSDDGGMRRLDAATLQGADASLSSAVIDPSNGFAYFGMSTHPAGVLKVALGTGSGPPTRVGVATLGSGEEYPNCAAIDAANGYAYFGLDTASGMGADLIIPRIM